MTTDAPEPPPPPPEKENPRPWPTYGYDDARTHISPYDHRPPYRRLWRIDAHDTLEFPPSIGYGRVYLAQQKGLFFALDAETGKVDWRKKLDRCAASSPTIGKGLVYQSYMHRVECLQDQGGADGFVVAWDADTGRERWRFRSEPIESSPLLKGKRLFVGTWDGGVYALNAETGKRIWRFGADDQVNTSAAYWKGRIFIGSDGGTLYALSAKTGKLLWSRIGGARVLVRHPHGRLRARLRRQHRRHHVRVRREERQAALGAPARLLHLRRGRGGRPARVRGHLRRQVLRAGRRDGRHEVADRRKGRGARRAHGDGRPRVLRDLLHLRLGGAARGGQHRLRRDLRRAGARRQARVALRRRQVREPGGGRRRARLHHRPLAPVRAGSARLARGAR